MKVSLIIPAYNEEKRLGVFLESIASFIAEHPSLVSEIIVVDDGSHDKTSEIARYYEPRIPNLKLHRLTANSGKGAAVQAGIFSAHGDYLIFIDADGATPISELPKMIAALQKSPIAVGNRWLPGAQTERHSLLRQLSGWVYRNYMRLFGLGSIDTMCGFKGYNADVAKKLFANLQEKRWLFDTEVAYKSVQAGYHTENFPIHWESKDGSKLSSRELIKSALAIWPLIQRLKKQSK